MAPYLIFHPASSLSSPHRPTAPVSISAPDRLAVCPSASDNRGSCCHSRFLGRPSVRGSEESEPLAAADLRAATPPTTTTTTIYFSISYCEPRANQDPRHATARQTLDQTSTPWAFSLACNLLRSSSFLSLSAPLSPDDHHLNVCRQQDRISRGSATSDGCRTRQGWPVGR